MRKVVVQGIGVHPFGRWSDKSTIDLCQDAIEGALRDAGVVFTQIEAAYLGAEFSSFFDARMIVQSMGWTGIPITQTQQACASGSAAFREAYHAIAAGRFDVALVVGYEKMGQGLLTGGDPASDREYHLHNMGLDVTPGRIAMALQRRLADDPDFHEAMVAEAVQSFEYGALNPNGHRQKRVTAEEVRQSPVICSPLTRLMCCPNSDGAAAVVICSEAISNRLGRDRGIEVCAEASGSPDFGDLDGGPGAHIGGDFKSGALTRRIVAEAYEKAGLGPGDIDVVQCHSPFAGGGILCVEALGFCNDGEGSRFWLDGHARLDGRTSINSDGGLIARGHPLGATGVVEICELVRQLRGEAGAHQVPDAPKVALQHNTGLGCLNLNIFKR